MTPTADALKGLVGAVRRRVDMCCGLGSEVACEACEQDAAALAAFEIRGRLREDRGLRADILKVMREVEEGRLPAEMGADEALDAIEAHLFGHATPTQEERER